MSKREPGRVRVRLAAVLLRDLGVVVDPGDLWCQEGGYRSLHWDLARWGAYNVTWADPAKHKKAVHSICSWDRMTACLRGVAWVTGPEEHDWEGLAAEVSRTDPRAK
jgi:hypothetical protein